MRCTPISPAQLPMLLTRRRTELWEAAIRASEWGEALLPCRAPQSTAAGLGVAHEWRIAERSGAYRKRRRQSLCRVGRDYAKPATREMQHRRARLADVVAPLLKKRRPGNETPRPTLRHRAAAGRGTSGCLREAGHPGTPVARPRQSNRIQRLASLARRNLKRPGAGRARSSS